MQSILIIIVTGALIGSWIQAGIVPAMVYYGLGILTPGLFLVASCIICAIVSPVSYTHLDVYKRQLPGSGNPAQLPWN